MSPFLFPMSPFLFPFSFPFLFAREGMSEPARQHRHRSDRAARTRSVLADTDFSRFAPRQPLQRYKTRIRSQALRLGTQVSETLFRVGGKTRRHSQIRQTEFGSRAFPNGSLGTR